MKKHTAIKKLHKTLSLQVFERRLIEARDAGYTYVSTDGLRYTQDLLHYINKLRDNNVIKAVKHDRIILKASNPYIYKVNIDKPTGRTVSLMTGL